MKDLQQIMKRLEEAGALAKDSGHQLLTYLIAMAVQERIHLTKGPEESTALKRGTRVFKDRLKRLRSRFEASLR